MVTRLVSSTHRVGGGAKHLEPIRPPAIETSPSTRINEHTAWLGRRLRAL